MSDAMLGVIVVVLAAAIFALWRWAEREHAAMPTEHPETDNGTVSVEHKDRSGKPAHVRGKGK